MRFLLIQKISSDVEVGYGNRFCLDGPTPFASLVTLITFPATLRWRQDVIGFSELPVKIGLSSESACRCFYAT